MSESENKKSQFCYNLRKKCDDYKFTWTIEDLKIFTRGEYPGYFVMTSPMFPEEKDENTCQWQIKLHSIGPSKSNNNIVRLEVDLKNLKFDCKMNYLISFINADGKVFRTVPLEDVLKNQTYNTLTVDFNLKSFFYDMTSSKNNQDFLKIDVAISVVTDTDTFSKSEKLCYQALATKELIDDLSKLFKNEEMCDVEINIKGTKLQAHRAILAARSPKIADMFKTIKKTGDTSIDVRNTTDCEPNVMKKLLSYLYTSQVDLDDLHDTIQLFKLADEFKLVNLLKLCQDYLILNLNTENVLDILRVADLHNAEDLKSSGIVFLCNSGNYLADKNKLMSAGFSKKFLIEIIAATANPQRGEV